MDKSISENVEQVKINGLFLFKEGMSSIFDEAGQVIPVTVLRYKVQTVSQVKTVGTDGYDAVQLTFGSKLKKDASKSLRMHFKKSGDNIGSNFVREIRQVVPQENILGRDISINSIAKGDLVNVSGVSKGHGFSGAVKRWGLAGGPGSHGSKFHRRPGSSGNRTWPGRVMPGKKFPGHWGVESVTLKNVIIVDVIEQDGVVLVKGPVPGARNSLVKLVRVSK